MSQPQYIRGLPAKEQYRQYRKQNPDKVSTKKYGKEYYREAVAKHRAKDVEETRFRWRIHRRIRRARLGNARVQKYIQKKNICNWESKVCGICDKQILENYHLDHIIPLSKGGEHSEKNLQLTHPSCNQKKGGGILQIQEPPVPCLKNRTRAVTK